jgi:hypothetical protein
MFQPQSDEEIRPVLEALRRLDPLLDIRWNPKAVRIRGIFDALGCAGPPTWDGRWEIIRYETPNMHADRTYAKIMTVTEMDMTGKYPVAKADGAYAPIGQYLVEYMALYDRAQSAWVDAMAEMDARHEAAESNNHNDYEAAHQEAAHKVFRESGGETVIGGGFGEGTATRTGRSLTHSNT